MENKHDEIYVRYDYNKNLVYVHFICSGEDSGAYVMEPIAAVDLARMIFTTLGPLKFIKTMIKGR